MMLSESSSELRITAAFADASAGAARTTSIANSAVRGGRAMTHAAAAANDGSQFPGERDRNSTAANGRRHKSRARRESQRRPINSAFPTANKDHQRFGRHSLNSIPRSPPKGARALAIGR
jgi:hypothetical protein